MILGKHAGSGKSTTCENLILHFKDKKHFVACPQNDQALEFKCKTDKDGNSLNFNSGTIYDLCGKRLNDDGDIGSSYVGPKEYEIVVFEECGQYTTFEWEMVVNYMTSFPNAIIIVNGDLNQNEPTENNMNPRLNNVEYYRRIQDYLFPEQILLLDPKRYKNIKGEICPILTQKAIQIHDDLFIHGLTPKEVLLKNAKLIRLEDIPNNAVCLTYTQDTRRNMNEYMHNRIHKNKYFVGLKMKANTRMMFTCGKQKYKIQKNFVYMIKAHDQTNTTIIDILNKTEVVIPSRRLINFSYCHAFTGHSHQGRSVDYPIVIFDYKHYYVSKNWMYPALTRNRKMEIYYCDEKTPDSGLDKKYVLNKIQGYKEQDKNKEFTIKDDYIDVAHVFFLSKKQKHVCKMCKSGMNFRNVEGNDLNWVVDRIDNNQAHTRTNTQLLCHNCNCSKK